MVYNIDDIRAILKNKLSEKRYEHTLGVEYTAAALAMRYGADMNKARVAGRMIVPSIFREKSYWQSVGNIILK